MNKISIKLKKLAKTIIASPTIWDTSPYKVTVYPDEAEGKHKERHIAVMVQRGKERGSVSIKDNELLVGNLSSSTMKWCINELLTEENKYRINIMIDNKDFYRLDRSIEVKSHPLPSTDYIAKKTIVTSWEDKLILKINYIENYLFEFVFNNGEIKKFDIENYIKKYPTIFKEMLNNPSIVRNVKIEPLGVGIYWNDLMGIEAEYIYDHSI